jgi:hypothetical protein
LPAPASTCIRVIQAAERHASGVNDTPRAEVERLLPPPIVESLEALGRIHIEWRGEAARILPA